MVRAVRAVKRVARRAPAPATPIVDPAALTRAVKEHAAELGISAVGVAAYDPRYTLASAQGRAVGDRVIVCIMEQQWAATQTSPSVRSERSAFAAFGEVLRLSAKLAEHVQDLGYQARPHDAQGEDIVLHYAVAAGLGQMGANGQVLTPFAGSRCRITTIETDAPLLIDEPVDYGVNELCDSCGICARRCPAGAIPGRRKEHRGVEKYKLNMARCAPVVAQAHGCAVCMKVCPVQRYGLGAVLDEFEATGRILGQGTEELEGYTFQDRHYGPGERPTLKRDWMRPEGLPFDPERKRPLADAPRHF
jgi:ferredoxin